MNQAVLVSLAALISSEGSRLPPYVFLIKAPTPSGDYLQTGFAIEGREGIITALHGVAPSLSFDGGSIKVVGHTGLENVSFSVHSVDINRDVALLRPQGLVTLPKGGPKALIPQRKSEVFDVEVFGHRGGIGPLVPSGKMRATGPHPLAELVPRNEFAATWKLFEQRGSPNFDARVYSLTGATTASGDSGAPVIDTSRRVVAICIGSIRGQDHNFAVPISDISFTKLGGETLEKVKRIGRLKLEPFLAAISMDSCSERGLPGLFYEDRDGDGFGAGSGYRACEQPANYSGEGGDCCDIDGQVRPNQRRFFTEPSKCGGYDYDCNGSEEKDRVSTAPHLCGLWPHCDSPVRRKFLRDTLVCGESGQYLESCVAFGGECVPDEFGERRLGCR